MSTYDTSVYRDNAFQKLYRHLGSKDKGGRLSAKLLDWNVDDFGQFPVPTGLARGNLKDQVLAGHVNMDDIYDGPQVKIDNMLVATLPEDKQYCIGLEAVYKTVAHIWDRTSEMPSTPDSIRVQNTFYFGMLLGQHTPVDAQNKAKKYMNLWNQKSASVKEATKHLLRLASSGNVKKYRIALKDARIDEADYPRLETPESRELFRGEVIVVGNVVIWWDFKRVYILTREDIDRIVKMLQGLANALFYMHSYGQMSDDKKLKIITLFDLYVKDMIDRFQNADFEQAQWLGRGYDIAYYIALARYSSDIDTVSLAHQVNKAMAPELKGWFDAVRVSKMVGDLPIKEGLELLLLYKILPPGDYDYFGSAERQRVQYTKQHQIEDPDWYHYVMCWHKKLMIKAYHARHGVCPGHLKNPNEKVAWEQRYPAIDPDLIVPERVVDIVITGTFSYADHSLDVFDMVKDKAICPETIESIHSASDLHKLKRHKKNQLLDVMSRPAPISMTSLRANLKQHVWHIKTEIKAEGKKPYGRWFMECHTDVRLVMSEYEASIANYGKYLEGYVLGKGIREKQKCMNHVTEALGGDNEYVNTFWSLDVDKWSPNMPLQLQTDLNAQWSDAFGMPHIRQLDMLFTEGDLHFVQRKIHHVLPKTGNDYEGLSGKKLTMYHLAVMHAAAAKLRNSKLVHGNARFAVLVDDGVLRLYVRRATLMEDVAEIRKEITIMWKASGIAISWDKTFVSSEFAIFLNEIRYANRAVNAGIRAIIKMTNYVETAVPSVVEDLQKCESTARGAIVAGSILTPCYFLYAMLVVDTLRKWAGADHEFQNSFDIWAFAPVALGGAGMVNAMTMCGSLDYNATQSGLGNMFMLTHRIPALKPYTNRIMNQEMRAITTESRITSPTTIRREDPIFRVDRLRNALKLAMAHYLNAPVLQAYNIQEGVALSEDIANQLSLHGTLPVELLDYFTTSTVAHMLETIVNKVLKSSTALTLLPRRDIYRAAVSNVTEARKVMQGWR